MEYILPDMQWQLVIEYMTAELGGEYLCSVSSTIAICRYVHSRDVPNNYVELNYLANW